eukprot:Sro472_g149900.2  (675) ;mRNA; r:21977-24001
MLFDMMINAYGGSLVTVIVTKTLDTQNHLVYDNDDNDNDNNQPFSNLTELHEPPLDKPHSMEYMYPPTSELIRKLWDVQPTPYLDAALNLRGDICDAICLAADCLYHATVSPKTKQPKRFRRKIVLLTDAGHPIVLDQSQILHIIDALRQMDETPIHVLGLGFGQPTVEFDVPLDASAAIKQEEEQDSPNNKRIKSEQEEPMPDEPPSSQNNDNNNDNNDNDTPTFYNTLDDRERLLASLTKMTGGSVVNIATMQELLDAKAGKRIAKAAPKQVQLHVGPGLTLQVRSLRLLNQESSPKIIERAVKVGPDGVTPLLIDTNSGEEEEETEFLKTIRGNYFEKIAPPEDGDDNNNNNADDKKDPETGAEEDNLVEIDKEDLINAIPYGKDLIPYPDVVKLGLKFEEDCGYEDETFDMAKPYIHIIGYIRQNEIPPRFWVGPPYAISGWHSRKACYLVAAMAQSLQTENMAALCAFKASSTGSPSLACLLPFIESSESSSSEPSNHKPTRMLLFKLPFEHDLANYQMPSFEPFLGSPDIDDESNENSYSNNNNNNKSQSSKKQKKQEKACEELIDAMMLPDDVLASDKIASPYQTSFFKTILQRAVRKNKDELVFVRKNDPNHPMTLPADILERAMPALEQFHQTFPMKKKKVLKGGRGREKSTRPTYKDYLDEEGN